MKTSLIMVLLLILIITSGCSSGTVSQKPATSSSTLASATMTSPKATSSAKISPSSATSQSTPKQTKNLAKAKDYYEMALTEAKKWHGDVKFRELHADNATVSLRMESIDKIALAGLKEVPMNGTAETWAYVFMSNNAKLLYKVEITNGSITKTQEVAFVVTHKYEDMRGISDWLIDSPEALEIAKSKISQDISNGAFITYALFNTRDYIKVMDQVYVDRFRWQITIRPYKQKTTVVEIDGTTKEVIKVTELS